MSKTITIDPVTRISGFMEIKAEAEDNTITKAEASGLLFRGFEKMLVGRVPFDATYFTERICGICSTAHSVASSLALEDALKITVSQNDQYIRDILHGFEFVQNHLRHFYQLTLPSYVKISGIPLVSDQEYTDFRLPEDINKRLEEHYITSIEYSRLAHEGVATLGGKAPHNHGIFTGGVTTLFDAYKLEKVKSIIQLAKSFVSNIMLDDVNTIAEYYSDYFTKGMSYPYFLTYGVFDRYDDPDITYVKAGILADGVKYPFSPDYITEQVRYAWYLNDQNTVTIDITKPDAYTFIKAPRYNGLPMEVGPLARLMVAGEYTRGNSCMDRIIARVLEVDKVLNILDNLVDRVTIVPNNQQVYSVPQEAYGAGLIDTTRGALGHWIQIQNQLIYHYNIITPSVWNISPMDDTGLPGVIEKSLIGTVLNDVNKPVEIGRIIRSFDPCVSCATHLVSDHGKQREIEVLI